LFAKPFNSFARILDWNNTSLAAQYESVDGFACLYVFIANNFPAKCSHNGWQYVENGAHGWRKERSVVSTEISFQPDAFRGVILGKCS